MIGNAVVTENILKEARDLLRSIREDKRRQVEKLEEARDRSRNNRRRLNDNLERQRQLTESLNRKQALLAENREGISMCDAFHVQHWKSERFLLLQEDPYQAVLIYK